MKTLVMVGLTAMMGLMGAASAADLLVAQTPADPVTTWGFSEFSNLSALGILAVVVIFLVCRHLPNLHAQFVELSKTSQDSMNKQAASFTVALKDMHSELQDHTRAVTELRTYCAGKRPNP